MRGVRFTFFCLATGITRMTDYDSIQELMDEGLEKVANQCIKEVFEATGIDLNKLADPYPALNYCSFSELSFDSNANTILEGKRYPVVNEN